MKIGIHQINFLPWFPFFYKMEKSDVFVLMSHCQFEKNGFQNRANVNDQWWTLPVESGTCLIKDKKYVNGYKVSDINTQLIFAFAKVLSINTDKIHSDFPTDKKGTDRIVEICKKYDCYEYITNPEATEKYLDEKVMKKNGIMITPCDVPKEYKKSLFEMFDTYGIDGTTAILKKDFVCKT